MTKICFLKKIYQKLFVDMNRKINNKCIHQIQDTRYKYKILRKSLEQQVKKHRRCLVVCPRNFENLERKDRRMRIYSPHPPPRAPVPLLSQFPISGILLSLFWQKKHRKGDLSGDFTKKQNGKYIPTLY